MLPLPDPPSVPSLGVQQRATWGRCLLARAGSLVFNESECLYEPVFFYSPCSGFFSRPCFCLPVSSSVSNDWHGILWEAMEIFAIQTEYLVPERSQMQHLEVEMPDLILLLGGNGYVTAIYSFCNGNQAVPWIPKFFRPHGSLPGFWQVSGFKSGLNRQ